MAPAVEIPTAVVDALLAHARAEAPRECCGLLVGVPGRIREARRARNAAVGVTRFLVHPEDHFAAIREARASGQQVLGAYHSHPNGSPIPSPTDIERADDPAFLHVIVSSPDVRAYLIGEGRYEVVPLVVTA